MMMVSAAHCAIGRHAPALWRATRGLVDVPLGRSRVRPDPASARASDAVLYEVASGVATLTLNRPQNKNALSFELVDALGDRLAAAQSDEAVRVIVLTNAGNTFCAGADLKGGAQQEPPRHTLADVLDDIIVSPKPVIGRIAGHCTGGGVGLAAAADISVLSDEALMGFTEVRLGVCPAVISVVCLPKLRRADASELFLSGERITAARAVQVGLVNYAVPLATLDETVDAIVGKVVRGGPNALAASKELVAKVPMMSRDAAFDWTAPLSAKLFKSAEAKEGITAFKERRDASWVPDKLKVLLNSSSIRTMAFTMVSLSHALAQARGDKEPRFHEKQ